MKRIEEIFLRNELVIYGIFVEIMIILMLFARYHRGYWAAGGEVLVMLFPAMYSIYVRSKK